MKHPAIFGAILALTAPIALRAADGHDHTQKIAAPNGGRVMTETEPHFEFLVTPERKLKITFLGDDGKPAPLQGQSLTATGGDRAKPTKFAFAKDGDSLVSDQPLPAGTMVPLVMRVKTARDAKPVTVRLNVNLGECPGCKKSEYACTCESHAPGECDGKH